MSTFGPTTIYQGGRGVRASRSENIARKVAGLTIDWATVAAAAGSDTTLPDGRVIPAGVQYLRYGQILCRITASGKFGPYASGASDGRQTLAAGDCWVLDETVAKSDLHSDHPAVFDGGTGWTERITDVSGAPALSAIRAAFPRLRLPTASS